MHSSLHQVTTENISIHNYYDYTITFTGASGIDLNAIIWEATRRVEQIGLHVVAFICDGAKPNRNFFRDHKRLKYMKEGVVYKTPNIYRPGNFVYFFSDVPHLLKTTRNAWANSTEKGSRNLTVISYSIN